MPFPGTTGVMLGQGPTFIGTPLLGGFSEADMPQSNDWQRMSLDMDGTASLSFTSSSNVGVFGNWSISVWMLFDTTTNTSTLMSLDSAANLNDILVTQPTGTNNLRVVITDNGGTTVKDYTYSSVVTTTIWQHYVITFNFSDATVNDQLKLYRYGEEITTGITRTTNLDASGRIFDDTTRNIVVGSLMDGRCHSAALWSSTLSESDVRFIWNHGNGGGFDLTNNYRLYQQSHNLKHWYRCGFDATGIGDDFGNGTAQDLSPTNVDNDNIYRESPDNGTITFNGTDMDFTSASGDVQVSIGNIWTLSCWINTDSVAAGTIFEIKNSASNNDRVVLNITAGGNLRLRAWDSAGTLFKDFEFKLGGTGSGSFNTDEWYHVAATFDGTDTGDPLLVFINGRDETSGATLTVDTTGTMGSATRTVYIALDSGGTDYYAGEIKDISLWSSELTSSEIAAITNGGVYGRNLLLDDGNYASSTFLKHWWRIGQGKITTLKQVGGARISDDIVPGGNGIEMTETNIDSGDVAVQDGELMGTAHEVDVTTQQGLENTSDSTLGIANAWTVAVWAKATNPGGGDQSPLWMKNSTATNNNNAIVMDWDGNNSDRLRPGMKDSSGTDIEDTILPATHDFTPGDDWHLLVLVWDGTTSVRRYAAMLDVTVTGGIFFIADPQTGASATMTDTGRSVHMGRIISNNNTDLNSLLGSSTGKDWFDGLLGHAIIWDTALSENAIREIYSRGFTFTPSTAVGAYASQASVVHWYKPSEDPGNRGKDYVGSLDLSTEVAVVADDQTLQSPKQ